MWVHTHKRDEEQGIQVTSGVNDTCVPKFSKEVIRRHFDIVHMGDIAAQWWMSWKSQL